MAEQQRHRTFDERDNGLCPPHRGHILRMTNGATGHHPTGFHWERCRAAWRAKPAREPGRMGAGRRRPRQGRGSALAFAVTICSTSR